MSSTRGRWLGEFVVVVIGVLVALAVENWREDLADQGLEQRLLQGIVADLVRDTADLTSAIRAAEGRAAGADELLTLLDDPDAGIIVGIRPGMPLFDDLDETLSDARAAHPVGSISAREALQALGSLQTFDLSDATFSEATASGRLGVIQDPDLRAVIAAYYFEAGRFGNTVDGRVEAHWLRGWDALAEGGLTPAGGGSDVSILALASGSRRIIAELKNLREFALRQITYHTVVLASAEELMANVEDWVVADE